jgi:hypothetical protein
MGFANKIIGIMNSTNGKIILNYFGMLLFPQKFWKKNSTEQVDALRLLANWNKIV